MYLSSATINHAARTAQPLFAPLSKLFLEQLTDRSKARAVWQTYNHLDPDNGLSYEGWRQMLKTGRFPLDQLTRLCEAMQQNGLDPAVPIAALEAACLPRDPDLDGNFLNDLCSATEQLGNMAADMREHGHSPVDYTNEELRDMMANCGRLQAAVRRLYQECLAAYAE